MKIILLYYSYSLYNDITVMFEGGSSSADTQQVSQG